MSSAPAEAPETMPEPVFDLLNDRAIPYSFYIGGAGGCSRRLQTKGGMERWKAHCASHFPMPLSAAIAQPGELPTLAIALGRSIGQCAPHLRFWRQGRV